MSRYGYFPDSEFPAVSVSTTFDRKQFGELEVLGTFMQYKSLQKSFWDRIGPGGSITAAPVFWKDMLFFGACDKNFYCLTLKGKEKWRFRTNGVILCEAAIHSGTVFFGSADQNVYALDCSTGEIIWRFSTSGPVRDWLIFRDGILYAASYDGNVYVIDGKSGKELWRINTVGPQVGSFEKDGVLYFGYWGGVFYAYEIRTRKLLWTFRTQKDACGFRGCFWKNNVYIGSFEGNVYAIDRKTGTPVWKFSVGDVVYPPIASGNRIYFGSRDFNVYCAEAKTGRLIWKFKTGGLTEDIIESGGRVYFASYDNNVYCVDSASGQEIWRFRTNGFVNYISLSGNRLYFGSWDCHMYCVDAQTGKLIWKFKTSLGAPSQIEPPETGMLRSAEVVWKVPEGEKAKTKPTEQQLSDYAETKDIYASAIGGDYLGKKKRGYV